MSLLLQNKSAKSLPTRKEVWPTTKKSIWLIKIFLHEKKFWPVKKYWTQEKKISTYRENNFTNEKTIDAQE